ncbi:alpha/beta fold hydrolase [Roseomonas elaeocarpi]|uniref:Alpha/beta fold hydrolase n=1 Tax=Roseomonas elaeocarpi TaxID=907779 RepID=A0ABV6JPA5_9PROT
MRLNIVQSGPAPTGTGAEGEATRSGTPVVLLHGLFGQARNFGLIQREIAARAKVISLDLRNHGESPHAAGMDYRALAEDVADTLRAAGAVPAAVLGHSMGGKVAMTLALRAPEVVRRLVVADIAPVTYPPFFRSYAEAMLSLPLRAGMTRREAEAHLASVVGEAGVRAFLLQNLDLAAPQPRWRIGLREISEALPEIEGWPELAEGTRYDGPVLFLRGGRSDYVQPEYEERIRALFPRVEFATVEKAGHWVHAEDPVGFLAAVTPFLTA